jgi:MFS family permease
MGRKIDLVMLIGGMGLSAIGTHVTFIALPFHLRSGGPYVISAVMMASLIPVALGGPVAGWIVDHYSNRRVMIWAQLGAAAASIAMLFALGTLPVLLFLLVVLGSAAAVTSPAMSALLPRLTGERLATRGYSALATARSMGTLVGLGLGGVLAAGPGIRAALLVDAASFLVLAGALQAIRVERDPRRETGARPHKGSARDSALAGLRRLAADRVLLISLVGLCFAVLLAVLVNVADVYFVTQVLHAGGLAYGVIAAAWAIGMVAGARLAGRLNSDRRLALGLFGCGVGMGAVLLIPAAFPTVTVTVIAWLIGGACNAAQNVAIQGLVRARVPDALRGRAFAGMNSAIVTANVLGTFVGGPATATLGPRLVFVTAGLGTMISAALALVRILPALGPALDGGIGAAPTVGRGAIPAAPMDPPGAVIRTKRAEQPPGQIEGR